MINSKEFKFLSIVSRGKKPIKTKDFFPIIQTMLQDGNITLTTSTAPDPFTVIYRGCKITQKGRRAMEEYKKVRNTFILSVVGIILSVVSIIVAIVLGI